MAISNVKKQKQPKSLAQVLAEMNQPKKALTEAELKDYNEWKSAVRAAYPKAVFDKEGDEYINSATLDGVEIASFEDGEGYVAPVDDEVERKVSPDDSDDFKFDQEDDLDEAKKKDEPEDEDDKEKVKEVKQDDGKEDESEKDDLDISGDDEATEKAKESMGDDDDDKESEDEFSFADFADDDEVSDDKDSDDKEDKDADAEEDAEADIDDLESDDDKEDKEVKGKDKEDDDEVTVVVVSPDHDLDADKEDESKEKKKHIKEFSMDEHMSALLQGETLSEEFKEKTRIIFEAALKQALNEHKQKAEAKLLDKYNKKLASVKEELKAKSLNESKKVQDSMIQSVDGFLTSEAKKWTKENRVALEKNIRADLAEGFIDGLKTLFTESYIEVPQEKFDVIAAQEETIKQLEESLAKSKQNNTKLIREGVKLQRANILNECMADLPDTQKVKLEKLVESVEFDKPSEFRKQVTLIKESYFTEKEVPNIVRKQLIEEVEIEVESTPAVVTGPARQTVGYVAAIDRLFKQS